MKKILILGNDGYIGSHVENWLKKDETLEVDGLCIKNDAWKDKDFTGYDVIFIEFTIICIFWIYKKYCVILVLKA